jgi:hypothetical protein
VVAGYMSFISLVALAKITIKTYLDGDSKSRLLQYEDRVLTITSRR